MIKLETISIPIEEVVTNPQIRKVKGVSEKKVKELAKSIQNFGLIHPIVVNAATKGDWNLITGEHRLRAFQYLYETKAPCKWSQFENWTLIPARIVEIPEGDETSEIALQIEENLKRNPVYWQDEAIAVHRYHTLNGSTITETAELLSVTSSYVGRVLGVAKAILTQDENVLSAETLSAAMNMVVRKTKRNLESAMEQIEVMEHTRPEEEKTSSTDPLGVESKEALTKQPRIQPAPAVANISIMQGDFHKWASTYTGPKFNFVHCDFPYGINHHKSAQGKTAEWGAYADSEDVYWKLIETLAMEQNRLMTRSSHIMFWFSMKHYTKTVSAFTNLFPTASINPFPLVWHKSDNVGIIPDPRHTPRQIYETALLISLNKREIIRPISNLYAAPKSTKTHVSEKPVSVLHHFYRMFLDRNSRLLDPTCGSGNSIIAALKFNPEAALGIELNPDFATEASRNLKGAINLHNQSKEQEK